MSIPEVRNNHKNNLSTEQSGTTLPEVPCSVNGFFHVDGYPDRFQATGRGSTAQDAARNLRDTITATKTALEAPVPTTREQRLSTLLTCGLTRAVAKGDWGLVQRLSKAAALALSGAVEYTGEGATDVRSQREPTQTWYTVGEDGSCTCQDWRVHHKGDGEPRYRCKHVLAVLMVVRLEEPA